MHVRISVGTFIVIASQRSLDRKIQSPYHIKIAIHLGCAAYSPTLYTRGQQKQTNSHMVLILCPSNGDALTT